MVCYSVLSLSIGCEFMFKSGEVAILVSSAFVGCLLTGPYAGYKTDLVGRRKTCLYSLAFSLLGSIGSALMPNFVLLVIFRLLTGLLWVFQYFFALHKYLKHVFHSLTAVYVSSLTYLMEYTKTSLRPMFSNSVNYCSGLGCIFVPRKCHYHFYYIYLKNNIVLLSCSNCPLIFSTKNPCYKHHELSNATMENLCFDDRHSWHTCLYRDAVFTRVSKVVPVKGTESICI